MTTDDGIEDFKAVRGCMFGLLIAAAFWGLAFGLMKGCG